MKLKVGSRRPSAGFTLIEMLTAATASALLLSINAVWIYQTMKFSARVSQRHRDHQNLTRLADEFRDDVRSCRSIEVIDENEINLNWQVHSSDSDSKNRTASYKIEESQVLLTKQIDNSQNRTERYSFSNNTVVSWDVSDMPATIGLLVSRDPAKSCDPKSGLDHKVDSTDGFPVSPTPADQLVTLLHVRVGPKRWGRATLASNSETESESQSESESQPDSRNSGGVSSETN